MVASDEVLDALKQIGLNLYERKLYTALLSRGTSTAGELSEIASVPRSRAYDVLESLEEKGFVVIQNSKPLKYVAVAPEEAFERHREKLKEEFQKKHNRIGNVAESGAMSELNELYSKGLDLVDPGELTGSIQGRHSLHQQISSMLKGSSENVSLILTPTTLNEFVDRHMDLLEEAKDKGVNVRIATHHTDDTKDSIERIRDLAEVRDVSHLGNMQGRFLVSDSKQFILGLTHDEEVHHSQDLALWSKSEHGAKMFEPLFDLLWEEGEEV